MGNFSVPDTSLFLRKPRSIEKPSISAGHPFLLETVPLAIEWGTFLCRTPLCCSESPARTGNSSWSDKPLFFRKSRSVAGFCRLFDSIYQPGATTHSHNTWGDFSWWNFHCLTPLCSSHIPPRTGTLGPVRADPTTPKAFHCRTPLCSSSSPARTGELFIA
jgi:hypothetical protein